MIEIGEVKAFNKIICQENNQESVLINENNLLSALSVQQWFNDDIIKYSALFRSLIQGHPFQDGNKRTAVLILIAAKPPTCTNSELCDVTIKIAKGELKDPEVIAKLLYR